MALPPQVVVPLAGDSTSPGMKYEQSGIAALASVIDTYVLVPVEFAPDIPSPRPIVAAVTARPLMQRASTLNIKVPVTSERDAQGAVFTKLTFKTTQSDSVEDGQEFVLWAVPVSIETHPYPLGTVTKRGPLTVLFRTSEVDTAIARFYRHVLREGDDSLLTHHEELRTLAAYHPKTWAGPAVLAFVGIRLATLLSLNVQAPKFRIPSYKNVRARENASEFDRELWRLLRHNPAGFKSLSDNKTDNDKLYGMELLANVLLPQMLAVCSTPKKSRHLNLPPYLVIPSVLLYADHRSGSGTATHRRLLLMATNDPRERQQCVTFALAWANEAERVLRVLRHDRYYVETLRQNPNDSTAWEREFKWRRFSVASPEMEPDKTDKKNALFENAAEKRVDLLRWPLTQATRLSPVPPVGKFGHGTPEAGYLNTGTKLADDARCRYFAGIDGYFSRQFRITKKSRSTKITEVYPNAYNPPPSTTDRTLTQCYEEEFTLADVVRDVTVLLSFSWFGWDSTAHATAKKYRGNIAQLIVNDFRTNREEHTKSSDNDSVFNIDAIPAKVRIPTLRVFSRQTTIGGSRAEWPVIGKGTIDKTRGDELCSVPYDYVMTASTFPRHNHYGLYHARTNNIVAVNDTDQSPATTTENVPHLGLFSYNNGLDYLSNDGKLLKTYKFVALQKAIQHNEAEIYRTLIPPPPSPPSVKKSSRKARLPFIETKMHPVSFVALRRAKLAGSLCALPVFDKEYLAQYTTTQLRALLNLPTNIRDKENRLSDTARARIMEELRYHSDEGWNPSRVIADLYWCGVGLGSCATPNEWSFLPTDTFALALALDQDDPRNTKVLDALSDSLHYWSHGVPFDVRNPIAGTCTLVKQVIPPQATETDADEAPPYEAYPEVFNLPGADHETRARNIAAYLMDTHVLNTKQLIRDDKPTMHDFAASGGWIENGVVADMRRGAGVFHTGLVTMFRKLGIRDRARTTASILDDTSTVDRLERLRWTGLPAHRLKPTRLTSTGKEPERETQTRTVKKTSKVTPSAAFKQISAARAPRSWTPKNATVPRVPREPCHGQQPSVPSPQEEEVVVAQEPSLVPAMPVDPLQMPDFDPFAADDQFTDDYDYLGINKNLDSARDVHSLAPFAELDSQDLSALYQPDYEYYDYMQDPPNPFAEYLAPVTPPPFSEVFQETNEPLTQFLVKTPPQQSEEDYDYDQGETNYPHVELRPFEPVEAPPTPPTPTTTNTSTLDALMELHLQRLQRLTRRHYHQ